MLGSFSSSQGRHSGVPSVPSTTLNLEYSKMYADSLGVYDLTRQQPQHLQICDFIAFVLNIMKDP